MTAREVPVGKLPPALLASLLAGLPPDDAVRVGPMPGEDAAAVDVPAGVLVVASDPITLTSAEVGRHCVIVNANDVAVCGAVPRWFLATILLPGGTTEGEVEVLFGDLRAACASLGVTLVGGHTEVTDAVRTPVVAGTMLGLPQHGRVVTTGGARPGDALVQIGAAPVEGAAVLANEFGDRLADVDASTMQAARAALDDPGISVVAGALLAAALGATAMHDPTEGGLASGLCEMASAAGCALHVDRERVQWFEPGRALCRALDADPWATLASGCVLATFSEPDADHAVASLRAGGFVAARVGDVRPGRGVYDASGREIVSPARDEVARLGAL